MGWEYRMFQPLATAGVLEELGEGVERREDNYIALTPWLGLKRRGGGRGWELKTRTGVSCQLAGLERWRKEWIDVGTDLSSMISSREGGVEDGKRWW